MAEMPEMPVSKQGRIALLTGGVAALLASACCLGPLVLVMVGISGAWIGSLSALEPWRPLFLTASAVGSSSLRGKTEVVTLLRPNALRVAAMLFVIEARSRFCSSDWTIRANTRG